MSTRTSAAEHTEDMVREVLAEIASTTSLQLTSLLKNAGTAIIHPVLARSNFMGLTDADYVRISPVLLLASNIITSPRATLWYHTYIFGPQAPITDLCGRSKNVVHKIYPTYEEMPKRGWLSSQMAEEFMSMAPYLAQQAEAARYYLARGRDQPYHATLGRYLVLASTLIHEIAHAVGHTRFGPGAEMFFEDDAYCEAGFAFESFVLGGKLNYLHMRANRDPATPVVDFLQIQTAVWQKVSDVYSKVSPDHMPMRGKVPEVPEEYVFTRETIEKFFDQKFWEVEVPEIKGGCMRYVGEPSLYPWQRHIGCGREALGVQL